MHLLLVRFSSMGDVVLQTATINWLKSVYGAHVRLSFLTSKEFSSLVIDQPYLSNVITFDRRQEKWNDLASKVKALHQKDKIDLIVDLHATLRSWRLRQTFWMIPNLVVDKRRWERAFLVKIKWPWLKKVFSSPDLAMEPQVERIINDCREIFNDQDGVSAVRKFLGTEKDLKQLTYLKKEKNPPHPNPYIVVAPAASFAPKRWPIERFVELTERILSDDFFEKLNVVVLAGPADQYCEAFSRIDNARFFNLQGKTSLAESMNFLGHADFCVGNDSGMNHISEAFGNPVITIFGPTDERFGFAPHGVYSESISAPLWCRPCSTTGKGNCFRDKQYCMLDISVERVFSALKTNMSRLPAKASK